MPNNISKFFTYTHRLLKYHLGYEKVQIIGGNSNEFPFLLGIVEGLLKIYNLKKIRIIISEKGYNAGTLSFFGDRIFISKKLLKDLNGEEIESILAHEFSHAYYRDSFLRVIFILIVSIPLFYTLINSYFAPNSPLNGILFIITLLIFIFGIRIINWMSVELEILSDRDALLKIKNPASLEKALFKLYIHHSEKKKRPSHIEIIGNCLEYLSRYFIGQTHPYLKERIEHLKFANEMREKVKENNK